MVLQENRIRKWKCVRWPKFLARYTKPYSDKGKAEAKMQQQLCQLFILSFLRVIAIAMIFFRLNVFHFHIWRQFLGVTTIFIPKFKQKNTKFKFFQKNLERYLRILRNTLSLVFNFLHGCLGRPITAHFYKLSSTNFTWSILEYLDRFKELKIGKITFSLPSPLLNTKGFF